VSVVAATIPDVGNRIRELRLERAGLFPSAFSVTALAHRVGVSDGMLRRWEKGASRPSQRHTRALAKELGVSIDKLGLDQQQAPGEVLPGTEDRPSVAACYIVKDRRLLMVQRRFKQGTLEWAGPSGEIEPGETPEEAAVREVREEVGLEVVVEQRLGERVHPATDRHLIYFVCRAISGTAEVVDHEEITAVEWCELPVVLDRWAGLKGGIFPPVREYLERALGPGEGATARPWPQAGRRGFDGESASDG
jgi:8-oxo-dGTP diphosphatase